ncbi:MAG: ABC transporter permease, partial [Acidobacteria bacterium]|nr:ABC transporter permease [Acidobacteriota bacterium]
MKFWSRKKKEQELDDEVRSHLQMSASDRVERGESRDDANHSAQKEFGNVGLVKEITRETWGPRWLRDLPQDVRYAWRTLTKSPGFASVVIATLALGIGANTAIFSVVNPILFEPLPYPHAERILMISDFGVEGSQIDVTFGTYRELAQRSWSFDALGVADIWQPAITGTDKTERLEGQRISASYFRVLGIPPALGRNFDDADSQYRGPKVAILSDALVQRRFSGDATIIGRQITLDGDNFTVVGIMPRNFENALLPSAEIWAPLQYRSPAPFQGPEWGHHLQMVGRLKPGITAELARRDIEGIAHTPIAEFPRPPWANFKQGLIVHALQDDVTRGVRPALLAVLGAVLLVLTIACVNVTNLLLARSARRRGEFAMRAALGAGKVRLIRQMLTESLLLAAIGGALGLVVASWGISALVALSLPGLPRAGAIGFHGPVFVFVFGISTLIGLAVGLIPALQSSRGDLHTAMQESSSRTTAGHHLTRRALVVAEVALALTLLVSAGLLLRSLQRLFAVAPG